MGREARRVVEEVRERLVPVHLLLVSLGEAPCLSAIGLPYSCSCLELGAKWLP